jgi:malonate transporter and related proteins
MIDVINLALPFFGLIFLGYACGRMQRMPEVGLVWMNFFTSYVALPALFYRILAQTPFDQLNNLTFVVATTLATASAFALSYGIACMLTPAGHWADRAMAALAGGYGNIGYMGPGLALATLGPAATVPIALIFCFDNVLLFSLLPVLMALAGTRKSGAGAIALGVVRRIASNPLIIATVLGVISAAIHFEPPVALDRLMQFLQNAAAPCALFTLGVTVALRPFERVPWEVPAVVAVKLVVHPVLALVLVAAIGRFDEIWVYTAVLMAALPPALSVYIVARQQDAWVAQASGAVLLGTVASVVTLTTVMWLVKTHALPLLR